MPKRLILGLLALLVLLAFPSLADLYTEWLWFGDVGYQSIFITSIAPKGILGLIVFIFAFTFLFANLRMAVSGPDRPYVLFPGGGDIQPIILERRHLGLLAIGLSGLVAIFLTGIGSRHWRAAGFV